MKEKLLEIYRNGSTEDLYKALPFPRNFYWKFETVIEMFEFGRISNELLKRGYSKEDLYQLFPAEDIDLLIQHYHEFNGIEMKQIFEALADIYIERGRVGTLQRISKSPALMKDMSSILESIFPEVSPYQEAERVTVEIQSKSPLGSYTDEVLSVIKRVLSGENSEDIANTLSLSVGSVEDIIRELVKGTSLDELKKQYATYKENKRPR